MDSKCIFLDIDGTLVDYNDTVPESTLIALKRAQEKGHRLIIASGRADYMINPKLLSDIRFDGVIASGGTHVLCDGKTIYESIFSEEDVKFVSAYFRRLGIHYLLYGRDHLLAAPNFWSETVERMLRAGYSKKAINGAYGGAVTVENLAVQTGIRKLAYFFAQKTIAEISADLDGRFYVTDYSVGKTASDFFYGEMNLAGVNKASAIEIYMKHIGAPLSDSIAFGDSGNDLEMIRFAHTGVAMGNATDVIKANADYVTRNVDDNGIYHAFEHLGLI